MTLRRTLLLALSATLLAAGCGSSEVQVSASCTPIKLKTQTAGKLALTTGVVTRAPWVSGPHEPGQSADPHDGQGYDAAVGYALAQRLGFDRQQVTWTAFPFAEVLKSGPKAFDVNINQVTIRSDRSAKVDFSRPYYRARLAVVALKDSTTAKAHTLADLSKGNFAVVAGSTAAKAVPTVLPTSSYPDLTEVRRAVSSRGLDGLVTDYVTAVKVDADDTQLVDGQLVGVLAAVPDDAEAYGMVLAKGSPLTACVNDALEAMDADGTLLELEKRWLVEEPGWRWFS